MFEKLWDRIKEIKPGFLALYLLAGVIIAGILGVCARAIYSNINGIISGKPFVFDFKMLIQPSTWIVGGILLFVVLLLFFITDYKLLSPGSYKEKQGDKARTEGALENSRFLTDAERDKYFPGYTYQQLANCKKDGIPVRAFVDKKGTFRINFLSGAHS